MSIAVISLDIESRACTLTIDGALVPADSLYFAKRKDYEGKDYYSFAYAVVNKDINGMTQMTEYVLPQPEHDMQEYSMLKNGLASRIIDRVKLLSKDIGKFLNPQKS